MFSMPGPKPEHLVPKGLSLKEVFGWAPFQPSAGVGVVSLHAHPLQNKVKEAAGWRFAMDLSGREGGYGYGGKPLIVFARSRGGLSQVPPITGLLQRKPMGFPPGALQLPTFDRGTQFNRFISGDSRHSWQ